VLLGAWGGLVPFVGPYFGYAYTPDHAWHFTLGRLWLEIVPAAAAVLGGVLVVVSARRLVASGGAILAALGGGWFVAGRPVSMLWPHLGAPGSPAGTSVRRVVLEELGFFAGLGTVIVFFAALALGGCLAAAVQPSVPGAPEEVTDDDWPADDDADSTTTSGLPVRTAGSSADSGRYLARTADTPRRTGYLPARWDDATA
jgi:hypothetical protein